MKTIKRYIPELKTIFCLLAAGIAGLAVHANFEIADCGAARPLAVFFYKFGKAFTFTGWADILVFISIFVILRYVVHIDARVDIGTAILAGFFSLLYVVTESYFKYYTAVFLWGGVCADTHSPYMHTGILHTFLCSSQGTADFS